MFDKEFESKVNATVSKNLTHFIKIRDYTQADLASMMGVTPATVSNWCKGIKLPRMDKIDKLCSILNITRSDLIEDMTQTNAQKNEIFLDTIKELCDKNNISITKLEKDIGLSRGAVYKWSSSNPSAKVLEKLSDYFNVSIDYLVSGKIQESSSQTVEIIKEMLSSSSSIDEHSDEYLIINAYRNADSLTRDMVKRCLGISTAEDKEVIVDKIVRKVLREKETDTPNSAVR